MNETGVTDKTNEGERLSSFLGRSDELAALSGRLTAAQSGRGSLVLVAGQAGSGKSTLLGKFRSEALHRGAGTASARGWPPSADAPRFQLWRDAFWDRSEPSDEQRWESPFQVFEYVRSRIEHSTAAGLTSGNGGPSSSLVLTIDDLQWSDPGALMVLEALARSIGQLPCVIVAAYKTFHGRIHSPLAATLASLRLEPECMELDLQPLGEGEILDLVLPFTPAGEAATLARTLHEATGGNPLLLHAVLASPLPDHGRPPVVDFRTARRGAAAVSPRVADIVAAWTVGLTEQTQAVIQAAAVAGREFDAAILEAAMPIDEHGLDAALDEAELAGIVGTGGAYGRYRFLHGLVRDALYEGQQSRQRRRLHERIASALENSTGTARIPDASGQLARHYRDSGAIGPALEHARAAAVGAEGRAAWGEAIEFHELVLALGLEAGTHSKRDEASWLTALGRCYRNDGEYRQAWRFFMMAMDLFREAADGAGLAQVILEALRIPAPPERRQELVQHALAALDASPSAEIEAQLLLQQTVWMPSDDDTKRSERAAEIAERRDGPDIRPILAHAEGIRALRDGRPEDARRVFLQVHKTSAEQGRTGWALQLLATANSIPLFEGNLAEGAAGTARAIGSAKRAGKRLHVSGLLTWLAGTAMAQGRGEECSRLLLEAERANATHFGVAWLRAARAEVAGDIDAALALMPDPQTLGRQPGWLAIVHGARARIQYHAGNYDDARRELAQWQHSWSGLAGDNPADPTASFLHTMASGDAALAALAGEGVARRVYEELARWSWARFAPGNGGSLDWLRGALALRLGDEEAASEHFATGAAWAQREGCQVELGRCLAGSAETAARAGRHAEALDLLARARDHLAAREANLYLGSVATAVESSLAAQERSASTASMQGVAGLSKREIEVLELIAEGSTNADIADTLGISTNTVARHVTHILEKTGAVNRAEAASFGHRHDLIGHLSSR